MIELYHFSVTEQAPGKTERRANVSLTILTSMSLALCSQHTSPSSLKAGHFLSPVTLTIHLSGYIPLSQWLQPAHPVTHLCLAGLW